MEVTVIGAGLAGSECAWQLAQRGIDVILREMKPEKKTPAHTTDQFAELCCSNSLRSDQLENAVGLLKEELRRMGSLILSCADATRVAVDRHGFAALATERIRNHPRIRVVPGEVTALPEQGEVVVASGPLTSDALALHAGHLSGKGDLRPGFEPVIPVQQPGRIQKGIAVHDAVAQKLRIVERRNHGKDPALLRKPQMGLESHQVVDCSGGIVPPQLHHGIGFLPRPGIF